MKMNEQDKENFRKCFECEPTLWNRLKGWVTTEAGLYRFVKKEEAKKNRKWNPFKHVFHEIIWLRGIIMNTIGLHRYYGVPRKKFPQTVECPICHRKHHRCFEICEACADAGWWMDPIGTIHARGDDPLKKYE